MQSTSSPIVRGSVKDIYEVGTSELEFVFSDRISVFDKLVPTDIPHKGEVLARISAFWFQATDMMGIRNHFIAASSKKSMRVRRVDIIRDYEKITADATGYLIPIEFVSRYYVAGTLHDRISTGLIEPESLGFPAGYIPSYGERLPVPLLETGTKLEPVDVFISEEEAKSMASLTDDRLEEIWSIVRTLDRQIDAQLELRGKLIHPDGKKEFAIDADGSVMLVDTFGTPDEDRFWDAAEARSSCDNTIGPAGTKMHYTGPEI